MIKSNVIHVNSQDPYFKRGEETDLVRITLIGISVAATVVMMAVAVNAVAYLDCNIPFVAVSSTASVSFAISIKLKKVAFADDESL
jgi:hypothetical protein